MQLGKVIDKVMVAERCEIQKLTAEENMTACPDELSKSSITSCRSIPSTPFAGSEVRDRELVPLAR